MSSSSGEMQIDAAAASARLRDFFHGYASKGTYILEGLEGDAWERAAREEFLRRRHQLVTAFDDELLLAIGLGLVDVTAVAREVIAALGKR